MKYLLLILTSILLGVWCGLNVPDPLGILLNIGIPFMGSAIATLAFLEESYKRGGFF